MINEHKIDKPIVIIGMPSSGKSTVGKKLSKKIDLQFYDSDAIIEGREGLVVDDIHEYMGEKYFRKVEAETITEIVNYGPCVLSTGSDTFSNTQLKDIILNKTICIWLDVNIDTILERILRRNTRSILLTDKEIEKFRAEYEIKKQHLNDYCHIKIRGDVDVTQLLNILVTQLNGFIKGAKT